ncbi:Fimh-like protein [Gammaproteobacteria bacterium]
MLDRLTIFVLLLAVACIASAQNCQPTNIPASTPTDRFTDNGNGTVTDTITGLMWKRCAEGMTWTNGTCHGHESHFSWQDALQHVSSTNQTGGYAGRTDWRVPKVKELLSIVERQCNYPAINLEVFPNASVSYFWAGSLVTDDSNHAWLVHFNYGGDYWVLRYDGSAVRLMRAE